MSTQKKKKSKKFFSLNNLFAVAACAFYFAFIIRKNYLTVCFTKPPDLFLLCSALFVCLYLPYLIIKRLVYIFGGYYVYPAAEHVAHYYVARLNLLAYLNVF